MKSKFRKTKVIKINHILVLLFQIKKMVATSFKYQMIKKL